MHLHAIFQDDDWTIVFKQNVESAESFQVDDHSKLTVPRVYVGHLVRVHVEYACCSITCHYEPSVRFIRPMQAKSILIFVVRIVEFGQTVLDFEWLLRCFFLDFFLFLLCWFAFRLGGRGWLHWLYRRGWQSNFLLHFKGFLKSLLHLESAESSRYFF